MKPRESSHPQTNTSFQPRSVQARSPLNHSTPKPTSLRSSSSHPLNTSKPQKQTVHQGDTLWGIAQHQLGEGQRWHELQKPNGSHFTAQEAHKLQIGSSVYVPEQKATDSFYAKPYTNGFGGKPYEVAQKREQVHAHDINVQQVSSHQPSKSAANYAKTTKSMNAATVQPTHPDHAIGDYLNIHKTSTKKNDQTASVVRETAIGTSVASRTVLRGVQRTSPKEPHLSTPSSSPLPQTWAERERILRRVDQPSRNPARDAAKGRVADTAWREHLKGHSNVAEVVSQPRWRDPQTGKQMSFSDAKSRIPDFLVRLKNGDNHAYEIKATPSAAESSSAVKQRLRDRIALNKNALLGKGEGPHVQVTHATTKVGLPILGSGGNTALPGETQKHVNIKPRLDSAVHDIERTVPKNGVKGVSEGVAEGAAKGLLRGASRAAIPVGIALDTNDLTKTYQKNGFGSEFRSKTAGVAGGWAGAAAGAEVGATVGSFIPIPVVGTAAGALVGGGVGYLVGSGAASKVEQGVEKAAPKAWEGVKSAGGGIAGGAKSVWHGLFG